MLLSIFINNNFRNKLNYNNFKILLICHSLLIFYFKLNLNYYLNHKFILESF